MSADTSVLYYTNNLLSKDLLSYTLKETIRHCENDNCELILTSHYPLSDEYEIFDLVQRETLKCDNLYNHLIKEALITGKDLKNVKHKIFVVGKMPYSYASIFKQIVLSMEKCEGENIILMEHDCLYPDSYIPSVKKALINYGKNFSYCSFSTCFLNKNGFFKMDNGSHCLSGCAGKKKTLMEVFKRKIELAKNNTPFQFEPVIDILSPIILSEAKSKNEVIIDGHLCIDTFMKGEGILDIKHHLNADGFLMGSKYFHDHPYWGEDKKYINMISTVPENKWNYGIANFDY